VQAYNKKFQADGMKKITMKQVQDANPGVNWNRLRIGQKIVIPTPAG
jgi:LysM repeat protein